MTIEEKLAPYKDKNLSFYEAYLDCKPIEEMEGEILEDAKWSGYAITYGGIRYFTDEGIRGICHGTFYIKNGIPREILKCPDFDILNFASKLVCKMLNNNEVNRFDIEFYIRKNWYQEQIKDLK